MLMPEALTDKGKSLLNQSLISWDWKSTFPESHDFSEDSWIWLEWREGVRGC